MTERHGDFKDPLGLVRRMVVSRDRAAWAALVREALRYVLVPVDWVLSRWERRRLSRAPATAPAPVLIVGAPRSGSTLLYQVLTAHLPVSYPSNLTEMFPRSPITATARLGRFARRRESYKSYYGSTASVGSPNDAFSIWNRWLGSDRYRVPNEISDRAATEMRSFFSAWAAAFGQPFVNKNNRNTAALSLLAAELPASRFIVIRRDPLFVAQSLVHAREVVQGDRAIGWGLGAGGEGSGTGADYLVSVADQVFGIHSSLAFDVAQLAPNRVLEVGYDELCTDPKALVARVGTWLELVPQNLDGLEPFESTDGRRLPAEEFERLQELIAARFSD